MRVIVNADDFGYDDETVDATIECFERGALTSATIMPRMPATARAIAYALGRPDASFGVHLTYVSDGVEMPVLSPWRIPSLVGSDGQFKNSNFVRVSALAGRLPVAEIEAETRAQIGVLADRGIPVSHVDSHGHLHKFAPFVEALRRVLPTLGIERVRTVQDIYLRVPWTSVTFWAGPLFRRPITEAFRSTSHFYMPASGADESWAGRLLDRLEGTATLEIGVHPGSTERWRIQDRLGALAFTEAAPRRGHELVSWKDI